MKPIINFKQIKPELDREFAAYLSGKTVAIVGRADMHNIKQGALIDSHDVVVRIHWPIPYHAGAGEHDDSLVTTQLKWDPPPFVPTKWQEYVGEQTNIFYTSIHDGGESWCQDIIDAFVNCGGKFLCNESPFNQAGISTGMLRDYFPQRNVEVELFAHLRKQLGSTPLEGTVVIADILRHDIKEVYLTGFPCYVSSAKPKGVKHQNRVTYNDFKYLRSVCINHPTRIAVDPNMRVGFETY